MSKNMDKRLIFFTYAYNAERTIKRTINSLLNQTYSDFTYYCIDNGSTDATGEIIREYASMDSRIVHLQEKPNNRGIVAKYIPRIMEGGDNGYLAFLDSDDEYASPFLEKMFSFVKEHTLDIAVCGTEYVTPDGARKDTPAETLIFEDSGFAEHFSVYHKYITRAWGILYSLRLLPLVGFTTLEKMGYTQLAKTGYKELTKEQAASAPVFYDCIHPLMAFQKAKRAGVLSESLHKYYINPSTEHLSYRYTPNYFWWINFIQERAREFLLDYGPLSKKNENYLHIRFLIWLKYILVRLQNTDAPLKTRLQDITEIFDDARTKTWLCLDWDAVGIQTDKHEFLKEQLVWAQARQGGDHAAQTDAKKLIAVLERRITEIWG